MLRVRQHPATLAQHTAAYKYGKSGRPSGNIDRRVALGGENGTGVHFISLPPFFFELLANPCVLRRYIKEGPINKYTVQ
jgi:hypothetical protein